MAQDYDYQYDAYGNTTDMRFTETSGSVYQTAYHYDDGDHIIQNHYPSGRIIDIGRDAVRRIESIDSRAESNASPQSILANIQYRGDNQMTQCTYGNGLIDQRQYDLQGRLKTQQLSNSANSIIDQRNYSYDKNSNILSRESKQQNSQYQYDALDRLIQEGATQQTPSTYYYDLNDNRLRKDSENQIESYHYLKHSNKLDYTDLFDDTQQQLNSKPQRELIYNDAGRLYQLIEAGTVKADYLYNDQGQRTRKTVYATDSNSLITPTVTIYHYNQNGLLISETKEDGSPIKDYIHANGQVVAQIEKKATTESIYYLYTDHLNTARLATDQNQAVSWRWEGDAFGLDGVKETGAVVNLRFPGQYFDLESGLFYNWFRYYDPGIGRYLTSDPIGLNGGLNTYGYVGGNPVNNFDYDGLKSKKKLCNRLNALMHLACDGFVSCSGADSCFVLKTKKVKNQICLVLRKAVSACHGRKNDPKPTGHQKQLTEVQNRIKQCNKLIKRNNCCE